MLHYCVEIEEIVGEFATNTTFLFECDRLEQLDEFLLNHWRGEADKDPESRWFRNGDVAWSVSDVMIVKAVEVPVLRRYLPFLSAV